MMEITMAVSPQEIRVFEEACSIVIAKLGSASSGLQVRMPGPILDGSSQRKSAAGLNEIIIALSSSAAVTVLGKIILEYIRLRKGSISIRSGSKEVTVEGANLDLDEIMKTVNSLVRSDAQPDFGDVEGQSIPGEE